MPCPGPRDPPGGGHTVTGECCHVDVRCHRSLVAEGLHPLDQPSSILHAPGDNRPHPLQSQVLEDRDRSRHRRAGSCPGEGVLLLHGQVGRIDVEGGEIFRIPDEEAACRDGAHPHLMGIDGYGVDARETEIKRDLPVKERYHHPPEGCVDVEEHLPVQSQIREMGDGVDHPVLRRPGDADESDRIFIHETVDRVDIHPELRIQRCRPNLDPQDIRGLLEREVTGLRNHHVRGPRGLSLLCDPERLDVGLGSPGGRIPPREREVRQCAEPPDEEPLKVSRPGKEPGVTEVGLEEHGVRPRRNRVGGGAHRTQYIPIAEILPPLT